MGYLKYLRKKSVFSTTNVEEAESFYHRSIAKAEFTHISDRSSFVLNHNVSRFGKVALISSRINVACVMQATTGAGSFRLVLGMRNPVRFSWHRDSVDVSSKKGAIVRPSCKIKTERSSFAETLVISVPYSTLNTYYDMLIGKHNLKSLKFKNDIDLTKGPGAFLFQIVRNLHYKITYNADLMSHPGVKRGYEELVLGTILTLPHNLSTGLSSNGKNYFSPSTVTRAEEYMRCNLASPISITDLLQECQCSRRCLFSSFQSSRDYTPMEFLKEQRLQAARESLLQANSQFDNVADIAHTCGFMHLGRFSQSYGERFGEPPSETLKKRIL